MTTNYAYFISRDASLTIFPHGKDQIRVPVSHNSYAEAKKALIKKASLEEIQEILQKTTESKLMKVIESKGGVSGYSLSEDGSIILLNGVPVHNSVTARALELRKQGFPIDPFLKFLDNLGQNPSMRAVQELYDFLEHRGLPLTEDGHFLAYKAIRQDWLDIYSGTISNKVGNVVEVPRNTVDDDREHECSHGLHVGCMDYVRWYGRGNGRVVVVKVNPRDCVSVPRDHKAQKLRVCRYEVLYENQEKGYLLESAAYSSDGKEWQNWDTCDACEDDDWSDCEWDDGTYSYDELKTLVSDMTSHNFYHMVGKLGLSPTVEKEEVLEELMSVQDSDPSFFEELCMIYF